LPLATPETRAAVWRHAGLVRDAAGLQALAGDAHPLARLIARHAILREESRGAHTRSDFGDLDPALDLHHTITPADDDQPFFERWA
jgi:L-aspartate oxidase